MPKYDGMELAEVYSSLRALQAEVAQFALQDCQRLVSVGDYEEFIAGNEGSMPVVPPKADAISSVIFDEDRQGFYRVNMTRENSAEYFDLMDEEQWLLEHYDALHNPGGDQ